MTTVTHEPASLIPTEDTSSEQLERSQSQPPDNVVLPFVTRRFVDEQIPAEIVHAILNRLLPDEPIFALVQLTATYTFTDSSLKTGNAPVWMVFPGTRLFFLSVLPDGQTVCDTFEQTTTVTYQTGLARDEIRIADKTVTTGMWEGKRKVFKDVFALFALPLYEKYLYLARLDLQDEAYLHAIPLLQKSLQIEPTIKAHLLLAQAFSHTGNADTALEILQAACQFADPGAVFQELQFLFPDNLVLFLYLAVIAEKNHWWRQGIEIYQTLLRKTPDFDLYFLKLAEMYNMQGEFQTAIEYYQKFINLRTASGKAEESGSANWNLADIKCFAADPDVVKAFFDLGVIHERHLNDVHGALLIYRSLIRQAPFYSAAYRHYWHVYQRASMPQPAPDATSSFSPGMFLQVYQLLDPHGYVSLNGEQSPPAQPLHGLSPEVMTYRPIKETEHDLLMHPGEREYSRRIQHWLMHLVVKEDDAQGIEQYCEQVTESNYPILARTIYRVASFVGIDAPRCFISRGKIGLSVKNKERPFIFIGSEHLTEGSERYFSEAELMFAIAAQAEHIKSGHLVITDTDVWKSLGSASFDGFLMALQCLPAGGFIGRVTHRFATEGLKRVYKMTRYSSLQKILKFLEKREPGTAVEDLFEGEDEHRPEPQNGREADSLVKDQLVDFARHAVYTADRVGLLACHDIHVACSAIFKLAGEEYDDLKTVFQDGLLEVLKRRDKRKGFVYFEYAKRLSELMKFALSDEYHHLHQKLVILPETSPRPATERFAAYAPVLEKLMLLNQSRQDALLTTDEFFLKQQQLLQGSGYLTQADLDGIEKLQQACRAGLLTYPELHTKIVQLFERKREEAYE